MMLTVVNDVIKAYKALSLTVIVLKKFFKKTLYYLIMVDSIPYRLQIIPITVDFSIEKGEAERR